MNSCRESRMTLASNKVQVGKKVASAGYIIDGTKVYADPKKVESITMFPQPKCLNKLRGGWACVTNSTITSQAWQESK